MAPASETNMGTKRVPLVRSAILLPVLAAFGASGYDADTVLGPVNLDEKRVSDPKTFLTHDAVYSVFNAIAGKAGMDFCARVGGALNWTDFAPFADRLTRASSLGDFFFIYTSAVSKETNAVKSSFLVEDEHAYFTARRQFRPLASPAQVDAFLVATWIGLLHRVLDFRWDPSMLIVQLADPKALPEDFHGIRPIRCDPQGFSIRIPAEWLTHALPDTALAPTRAPALNGTSVAPIDFLASVKDVIRARVGTANLTVETAAKACGFTVSGLNRRLTNDDTSISKVIAGVRLEIAERELLSTGRSIGNIADDLGYSDATAFTRAFRKWTGQSPMSFRRAHRKQVD